MQNKLLSDEFLEKYKDVNPFPTEVGLFTYVRTYSKYLAEEKRREYWWETVARAIEYNVGLGNGTVVEAELIFDNVFNLRQFPSGRTLWAGGGVISRDYPMSNYNCAFAVIEDTEIFSELLYLLLVGSGVGFRALKNDVVKIPSFRQDLKLTHEFYNPHPSLLRNDVTSTTVDLNEMTMYVGDSKEGWKQAIEMFVKLYTDKSYRIIKELKINYNNVRPKGERLKRFGGFSSGHIGIHNIFMKLDLIVKANCFDGKLKPMEIIEILNIEGEGVVSGGVRRTAEIALLDPTDDESIGMKSNLYKLINDEWEFDASIGHRAMSNNSIYYTSKPTRERLHWQIGKMRYSGEPAWVNAEAGDKRRDNFNGCNPCGEILLDSRGMCNLTEINVMAFVKGRELLKAKMMDAQRFSARIGLRMTLPTFELHKWDVINKRDRLIGCSVTGWQDAMNALGYDKDQQAELLRELREVAVNEARSYAKELGVNEPLLSTTVKPSGTLSLLPTVSSGIHRSHSEYYIRRVRISYTDPLAKAMIKMGYNWNPENGETVDNMDTIVIDFPVEAPKGRTKNDVSAIEQLEDYLMFMENYVQHNVSITVSVKDDEWDAVEEFVWEHWDDIVAVSFISHDDSFYKLLPYEAITKEVYEQMVIDTPKFDYDVLQEFETGLDFEVGSDCEGGVCPVK